MAKVRIGIGTELNIGSELSGIGTDNPTNSLQALGNIHAPNAKSIGVSTLTTFDGFADSKASISGATGAKSGSTSGEVIIEGTVNVSSGTTFTSGPENLTVTDNFTLPGVSDDKPTIGSTRFNENLGALEFYTGVEWRAVSFYVNQGNMGRAVTGMWEDSDGTDLTTLEYVQIQSQGTAQWFGDLTVARMGGAAVSSAIRGLFAGGNHSPTKDDEIDYVALASGGDAIDFGNLESATAEVRGCSSSTRGLFAGGQTPSNIDVIQYVEISTLGNTTDFGNLTAGIHAAASVSSPTRGFWGGGSPDGSAKVSYVDSVTISSLGNAVKFGDLTRKMKETAACSNSVRGVFATGPDDKTRSVEYITMATEGNGTEFGNLTVARGHFGGASDQTRAVFFAGRKLSDDSKTKIIDYINIASGGNAVDFGEVTRIHRGNDACSDSHGGLGGF